MFCVSLVARMRCHIRGLVPLGNLQLLIYELVRLVTTDEPAMLKINTFFKIQLPGTISYRGVVDHALLQVLRFGAQVSAVVEFRLQHGEPQVDVVGIFNEIEHTRSDRVDHRLHVFTES